MRLALPLTVLTTLACGCATGSSIPPERPDILPAVDSTPGASPRILRLASGNVIYEFSQSSEVRPESSIDTAHSTITTEALLSVAVIARSDSTHEITVSVDSVRITASGSPLTRGQSPQSLAASLGIVLRALLGPETRIIEPVVPDSLCAYGHLVSAAREITLFPLPYGAPLTKNGEWTDSSRFSTCRAGAIVETHGIHSITYSGSQPSELVLQTISTVRGAGVIRTDSVTVGGTVRSSGKARLEGDNRLPILLRSESEGMITVQLGDSATVFHQHSTQEWHRRLPN